MEELPAGTSPLADNTPEGWTPRMEPITTAAPAMMALSFPLPPFARMGLYDDVCRGRL